MRESKNMQANVKIVDPDTNLNITPAAKTDVTSPTELATELDKKIPDVAKNLDGNSSLGGIQKLTVSGNVIVGTAQACRSCIVWTPAETVSLTLADEAADANDFLMLANQYLPVPVANLDQLRFYGSGDGEVIYVLWRN
jgi:hypothetical protein